MASLGTALAVISRKAFDALPASVRSGLVVAGTAKVSRFEALIVRNRPAEGPR